MKSARRVEIEFQADAIGIRHKNLPRPQKGNDFLSVRNAASFDPGEKIIEASRAQGDVIDGAGGKALWLTAGDDMNDRPVAAIKPGAGKIEGRARTFHQAKHVGVKFARRAEIGGDNRKMIEADDAHGAVRARARLTFRRFGEKQLRAGMNRRAEILR